MAAKRTDRLNSLLREVISEVLKKDVKHPDINELATITRVDITRDLRYAKVYVSVIGNDVDREKTLVALQSASGFIAVNSSKKVSMRYFPQLTFKLDTGVDEHMRIEELLQEINTEQDTRHTPSGTDGD